MNILQHQIDLPKERIVFFSHLQSLLEIHHANHYNNCSCAPEIVCYCMSAASYALATTLENSNSLLVKPSYKAYLEDILDQRDSYSREPIREGAIIAHGRFTGAELPKPLLSLCVSKEGIPWRKDYPPIHVVYGLFSPSESHQDHLYILACINHLHAFAYHNFNFVHEAIKAQSKDELTAFLQENPITQQTFNIY